MCCFAQHTKTFWRQSDSSNKQASFFHHWSPHCIILYLQARYLLSTVHMGISLPPYCTNMQFQLKICCTSRDITKAYITIAIRLRYDYDTTTSRCTRHYDLHSIPLRRKNDVYFLLAANCVERKQACVIHRSWIVVVSLL